MSTGRDNYSFYPCGSFFFLFFFWPSGRQTMYHPRHHIKCWVQKTKTFSLTLDNFCNVLLNGSRFTLLKDPSANFLPIQISYSVKNNCSGCWWTLWGWSCKIGCCTSFSSILIWYRWRKGRTPTTTISVWFSVSTSEELRRRSIDGVLQWK